MIHFTEEQLSELESIFGLTRKEMLPVRDGRVSKDMKVWWRRQGSPQMVSAKEDWENIKQFPHHYSIAEPKTQITYLD